ncbi:MAG: adaptor protein MecA, partial [Butyrivibrio sp.]
DNQIRCTLNRSDLLSREIKISELAYGTEKAKTLFHDMIEQASHQFGFEAEEVPLMIEAIPVSPDCIVLIITKVDDPEELDTRFSRFAPSDEEDSYEDGEAADSDGYFEPFDLGTSEDLPDNSGTENPSETFIPIAETVPDITSDKKDSPSGESESVTGIFSFASWDLAAKAAMQLCNIFNGKSSFYKDPGKGIYYLTLTASSGSDSEFLHSCNICSEYGTRERYNAGTAGYLSEHCDAIIRSDAIDILCRY